MILPLVSLGLTHVATVSWELNQGWTAHDDLKVSYFIKCLPCATYCGEYQSGDN